MLVEYCEATGSGLYKLELLLAVEVRHSPFGRARLGPPPAARPAGSGSALSRSRWRAPDATSLCGRIVRSHKEQGVLLEPAPVVCSHRHAHRDIEP
jgi:hypothetical protein